MHLSPMDGLLSFRTRGVDVVARAQTQPATYGDTVLPAHCRRRRKERKAPVAVVRMTPDASKRCSDHVGAHYVRRLTAAMRTARLQRLVMRGTAIFILTLLQHAVVSVRCALSAISESLVIPIMRRGTQ